MDYTPANGRLVSDPPRTRLRRKLRGLSCGDVLTGHDQYATWVNASQAGRAYPTRVAGPGKPSGPGSVRASHRFNREHLAVGHRDAWHCAAICTG